jgi:adenylylsulfate kinase
MRATEGFTIWLTGIPASGKTTLAKNITDSFHQIVLIDSEEAINIITPSSSFSQKERLCVYNGLIYSSFCLNKCGINVIIAATGNYRRFSEHARNNINNFIEVYINCSVETCMQRDPKGFYKKAKNGEITTLPLLIEGINEDFVKGNFPFFDVYEPPLNADLVINTENLTVKESTELLEDLLKSKNVL